jgi:hypothetical protein
MSIVRNLMLLVVAVAALTVAVPSTASAGLFCGKPACGAPEPCCQPAPCCAPAPVCEPAPVEVTFCFQNPVTCCVEEVTVCVPACCAAEAPCLDSTRRGFFKRQILTFEWACCGHCVDVVVTKHGRLIVRD